MRAFINVEAIKILLILNNINYVLWCIFTRQ